MFIAIVPSKSPLLDEVDADGPLLLKEDVAQGLRYDNGKIELGNYTGLGVQFMGKKFERIK